jgi:HEAT repeat protein
MKSAAVGTVGVLTAVLAECAGQGPGWSILVALGEFGAASEPAIPTIKEAVRRDSNLLGPALDTLGKIGPPGHAAVADIIRSEQGIPRQLAIEHVLRTGLRPPGLREALELAVQDDEPGTRRIALQALQRLGPEGATTVAALVAALRREPMRWMHRSQVPHALAASASVSDLFALVTDDDEQVRWGAFRALSLKKADEFGATERKRARELVRRAFTDKSPKVRHVAAGLLRQLPPAKVTPDLIHWAGAASEDGGRQAIAASLAAVGAPAVPALIRALRNKDPVLRRGAAATIAEMGPVAKAAIPALTSALTADDEDARLYAGALTAIGKDALVAWVEAYGKVKNKNARHTLRRAMLQQGAATVPHVDALRKKGDAATRRWTVHILGQIGEPALPALLDAASDPDTSAAGTALGALGRIRGHVAKIGPVLVRGLRRRETRRTAVRSLRSQGEAILPYLWQAAVDDDPEVRAGAYAASPSHGEPVLPLVRRGLSDPDDGARAAAVRAAGAHAKPLIPDLIRALRDKSERVRRAAAYALGHVRQVPKTALPELLRLFRVGTSGERTAAHAALIALDASPHVMRFLADPDRALRANAAGLLVKMGPAIVPSLTDMIKSHDDPARQAAAEVLARLGAQNSLVALLVDEQPGVRASAAYGLGRMGRRARGAVPDLIEALDDPEAGVVRKAVWALGEIGPGAEAAVPKLIEALGRPEPDIVREAVSALGKMGPGAEAAVPKLVELGKQKRYREPVRRALRGIRRGK